MKNIFGEEGLVYKTVNKIVDLILLNVVYMATCIPVLTVGAASTALYTVTLKMCKNEEGYIIKEYWKVFKSNIKKSTIIWCVFLSIFLVLGIDFWIAASFTEELRKIVQVLLCAVFLLAMMIVSYVFPLIAVFENTVKNYMKNAVIISMTRIGYTIVVVGLNLLPLILWFMGGKYFMIGMNVFIMIGWAGVAYVNSMLLHKVFERYK